jgi:hypothetical protein
MAFDPQRQGWPCRTLGSCDGVWFTVHDALVCQCARPSCRRVLAVITQAVPPAGHSPRAIDALQNTDGRPAPGWPGCID